MRGGARPLAPWGRAGAPCAPAGARACPARPPSLRPLQPACACAPYPSPQRRCWGRAARPRLSGPALHAGGRPPAPPPDRVARGCAQFGREKFTTQLERRRVCSALQGTLEMLGARQLVVGHTPQVAPLARAVCSSEAPGGRARRWPRQCAPCACRALGSGWAVAALSRACTWRLEQARGVRPHTPMERGGARADARARADVRQLGGANCECNGRVWRMDVGMSSGVLNAVPQARAPPNRVRLGL